MSISPFIFLNRPCDEVLHWAERRLSQAGLRAMQTFDLHTARAASHDCPCPNHGTEACDCQMVILLVYGEDAALPVTLFLHGNDGQTWLSIADEPRQHVDSKLLAEIRQVLDAPVSVPQDG